MPRNKWTRDELLVAFNLYCRTPFGRIHNRNPEIIATAGFLGRTPNALSWKLANFARLDPSLQSRQIAGASHGSSLDAEIWREFTGDWERLSYESERIRQSLSQQTEPELIKSAYFPEGKTREANVRVRVNQSFFRACVLAAYESKCCITGLPYGELLSASHIVPWSVDISNRTNPANGLCLNALHDRAFDRGLITINRDLTILVAPRILNSDDSESISWIGKYQGLKIRTPTHFAPDPDFLSYHKKHIFEG